jgi:hypothetical protein
MSSTSTSSSSASASSNTVAAAGVSSASMTSQEQALVDEWTRDREAAFDLGVELAFGRWEALNVCYIILFYCIDTSHCYVLAYTYTHIIML